MPEINSFLSKKADKQIESYQKRIKSIAKQYGIMAKSATTLESALSKEEKTTTKLNTRQKEAQKLRNQLRVTIAKQEQAENNINKKLVEEKIKLQEVNKKVKEQAKDNLGLVNSYDKLNKKLNDTRNEAKNLAIQYGTNSKQFKTAQKEVAKYDKSLKKVDSSLGQNQRKVGSYGKSLLGFAGQLGLVTGAAAILKKGVQGVGKIIQSTQGSGDKFNITMAGMKSSYDAFNKSLASGDLKNVFKNMKKAFEAGKAYAAVMDDLSDRERDLSITRAESKVEIEKLTDAVQNVTKSKTDRINAAKKIFEIEKKLLTQEQSVRQQDFDAQVKKVSELTGMKDDEILHFIKNYDEEKKLRENAIKLIEKEAYLKEARKKGWVDEWQAAKESIDKQKAGLTELEKKYIETYRGYSKTTDVELDKIVASYAVLQEAESSSIAGMRRIKNQYNTLIKGIKENEEKSAGAAKATVKRQLQNIETIDSKKAESVQTSAKYAEEEVQIVDDTEKRKADLKEEYRLKELEDEKEFEKNKAALKEATYNQTIDFTNALFSLSAARRSAEYSEIEENYDKQISAAEGNDEKQEQLERQKAQRLYQLDLEQAKADKRQSAFNTIITTAEGVARATIAAQVLAVEATGNLLLAPLVPLAWAQVGLVGAMGAAQLAAIQATPLPSPPQFALGTDYSPSTFIAGDAGTELMVDKQGNTFLTPNKATLYTNMEGTKILPNSETEAVMGAINGHAAGYINDKEFINKLNSIDKGIKNLEMTNIIDMGRSYEIQIGRNNMKIRRNRKLN